MATPKVDRLSGLKGHAASSMIRLLKEGFDKKAAKYLAEQYPLERIQRQCEWMQHRKVTKSRLGMLRKAIEQDWVNPKDPKPAKKKVIIKKGPRSLFKPEPSPRELTPEEKKKAVKKLEQLKRELKARWPQVLEQFEEQEAKERNKIAATPMLGKEAITLMLSSFDAPEKKLKRLRKIAK